jgi:hypothetical protein
MNISGLIKKTISIVIIALSALGVTCYADNPIIQTIYTADPAPMVYNDTFYMFTGHDEDGSGWFNMKDWRCFSTTDMANWTTLGSPMNLSAFSWASVDAWASQCVARNGKFYWYFCTRLSGDKFGIGVGVSDKPEGPYIDAIGQPLISGISYLDPSVFVDDDGQAYMYFGNTYLYYIKLNPDMISTSGSVVQIPETAQSLGNQFAEGPYLYKRKDLYYLIFAADDPKGEHISYSTSTTPIGPWTFRGVVMPFQGASWTNHPAVSDYKGNSYYIYHNGALPGGGGGTRSVCVEQFNYTTSDRIPTINMTSTGPPQIGSLNPYIRTEAECIAWEVGVETEKSSKVGVYVTSIDDGDYIKVKGVDFGSTGAGMYSINVASGNRLGVREGGTIELHLDSVNGAQIGVTPVSFTGGKDIWRKKTISVSGASGKRDLYLVFKGNARTDLFNADFWKFEEKTTEHTLAAINANVDKYKIDKVSGLNTTTIKVMAIYSDGTSEEITDSAEIKPSQTGVVSIAHGVVTGVSYGSVSLNVSYKGKNDTLNMLASSIKNELTLKKITSSIGNISLFSGNELSYTLTAEYIDGHTENITNIATYTNSDSTVAEMSKGILKAKLIGTTTITFSFKGELGITMTTKVNVIVGKRGPYVRFEAEDWSEQSGVGTESCNDVNGRLDVANIENGDWIKVSALDFGDGAKAFDARVASAGSGGTIELRLDSNTGKLVGTLTVPITGGWQTWVTKSCSVSGVTGMHDLYMMFKGNSGSLFNINWWTFTPTTTGIDDVANKNRPYIKVVNGQSWLFGIQDGDIISMYDVSGKSIYHGLAKSVQLLLPNVKQGVYITKIETGKETITLK